jgi:fructose-1,6-bisphosphatase/sedoheptulose 1,7-bisphosphatase-like protein
MEETKVAEVKKLTVNLTTDVYHALQELAEASGRTMTEELRMAIADRQFFVEQVNEGRQILLREPVSVDQPPAPDTRVLLRA